MWRFIKFLQKWLYCWFDTGVLNVRASGEYKVPLYFTPDMVWAEFEDNKGKGVCNAEPDGFDIVVIPKGFVLVVKLNSDRRKIRWFAIR